MKHMKKILCIIFLIIISTATADAQNGNSVNIMKRLIYEFNYLLKDLPDNSSEEIHRNFSSLQHDYQEWERHVRAKYEKLNTNLNELVNKLRFNYRAEPSIYVSEIREQNDHLEMQRISKKNKAEILQQQLSDYQSKIDEADRSIANQKSLLKLIERESKLCNHSIFHIFGSIFGVSFGFIIVTILGLYLLRGLELGRYGIVTTHPLKRHGMKTLGIFICIAILASIVMATVCCAEKSPHHWVERDTLEDTAEDDNGPYLYGPYIYDNVMNDIDEFDTILEGILINANESEYGAKPVSPSLISKTISIIEAIRRELSKLKTQIEENNRRIETKEESIKLLRNQIHLRDEIETLGKEIRSSKGILEEKKVIYSSESMKLNNMKQLSQEKEKVVREVTKSQLIHSLLIVFPVSFVILTAITWRMHKSWEDRKRRGSYGGW